MKDKIYNPQKNITNPYIKDFDEYKSMYADSINDPKKFFGAMARENLDWIEPFTQITNGNFSDATWFEDGKLNISANCIDRHLEKNANKTALIWEGDSPSETTSVSYQELHDEVCRLSNALKELGITKGSRVCIYMPMILEASYAMLACARIGAIHSVVFGGFSPEALKDRILDADCSLVITADEGYRGGKIVPLKKNVDIALKKCPGVKTNLVIKRTGGDIDWNDNTQAASAIEKSPILLERPIIIDGNRGVIARPAELLEDFLKG